MRLAKGGIVGHYEDRGKGVAILAVLLLISVLGISSGCHKKTVVTNLPAGVSQAEVTNWLTATGAMSEVARFTKAGAEAEIQLHAIQNNGKPLVPDDKHQAVLAFFGRVAEAGIHADNILKAAPQQFGTGVKSQINGILGDVSTEVQGVNTEGLTGLTPAQAAQLNQSIVQLQSTFKIVMALATN